MENAMKWIEFLLSRIRHAGFIGPVVQDPPAYDVVVSYAGVDREYAEKLVRLLQLQGVKVFYDQQAIDRLTGEPLPEKLRDIYENQGRYCVILVSERYKASEWTRQELQAALARMLRTKQPYILPILLDKTGLPEELSKIAFLSWEMGSTDNIVDVVLKKLGRAYRWDEVVIRTRRQEGTVLWKNAFTDVTWIGSEGWLSVAIHVGGGYGSVGEGALLHTNDGGSSWSEIDKQKFPSGKGEFTWGPQGTRRYQWSEIGPITAIAAHQRYGAHAELWVASSTGVYFTEDGGASWCRSTPGPTMRSDTLFSPTSQAWKHLLRCTWLVGRA